MKFPRQPLVVAGVVERRVVAVLKLVWNSPAQFLFLNRRRLRIEDVVHAELMELIAAHGLRFFGRNEEPRLGVTAAEVRAAHVTDFRLKFCPMSRCSTLKP